MERYAKMKADGMTWREVAEAYNEDHGTKFTKEQVRCKVRRTYEKTANKEEYKPKYELTDVGYIVRYGEKGYLKVSFTEDQLQEALKLYCTANLTLQETHTEMLWTRREFYAILKAFDIVKASLPVTPRQKDELSADQIAEYVRLNKLRYAQVKFEKNKHKDQEQRIKQMDNVLFWQSEICKQVNELNPIQYDFKKELATNQRKIAVFLTDIHGGLEVDNYFNTYNIDIMKQRLDSLANHLIDRYSGMELTVYDLGDTVHGIIHGSVKKYGSFTAFAVVEVINSLCEFLLKIAKHCQVRFTKVNGSHESIEKVKTDRMEEESFGYIIYEVLKQMLKNSPIEFIDRLKGLNVTIPMFYGYGIIGIHGDNNGLNKLKDIDRLFREYNVIEINCGHLHHLKGEDYNGLIIRYNEPFCGGDQFAASKLLNSMKGTRIVEYSEVGREDEHLFRY